MKTTVWYLLVICLIKVKEMVNYIFARDVSNISKYIRNQAHPVLKCTIKSSAMVLPRPCEETSLFSVNIYWLWPWLVALWWGAVTALPLSTPGSSPPLIQPFVSKNCQRSTEFRAQTLKVPPPSLSSQLSSKSSPLPLFIHHAAIIQLWSAKLPIYPLTLESNLLNFPVELFNQDLSQDIYNKDGGGDDGDNEYLRWHTSSDWRWVDNAMFGAPQPPLPHCTVLHLLVQKSEVHLASIANTSFYHSKPFQCKTAVRQIFFGKFYHVWKIWWNSNAILKRWKYTLEDLHWLTLCQCHNITM